MRYAEIIKCLAYCCKQKGIDFCSQCDEFPRGKINFDPNLKERWIKINARIKAVGVEEYYEETKESPRYI